MSLTVLPRSSKAKAADRCTHASGRLHLFIHSFIRRFCVLVGFLVASYPNHLKGDRDTAAACTCRKKADSSSQSQSPPARHALQEGAAVLDVARHLPRRTGFLRSEPQRSSLSQTRFLLSCATCRARISACAPRPRRKEIERQQGASGSDLL